MSNIEPEQDTPLVEGGQDNLEPTAAAGPAAGPAASEQGGEPGPEVQQDVEAVVAGAGGETPPPEQVPAEEFAAAAPGLAVEGEGEEEEEEKKRRWLLLFLLLLLALLLCCVAGLFYRYINKPEPLPEMLPVEVDLNYPPHYLFSIYGMERPIGVALSPDGQRLYVAETSGERLIRIFSREGDPLGSFAPPRTTSAQRSPVYLATDSRGRVFVSDRLQHAVYVYDGDGNYQDTILTPEMTLHEYVLKQAEEVEPGVEFAYSVFWPEVLYRNPGEETEQKLPAPDVYAWAPLGLRFDAAGNLLLTDVDADRNTVREFPVDVIGAPSWADFSPPYLLFGESGQGNGQLLFPNSAVRDPVGRVYVTDSNNGRISVWDDRREFLFHFGRGTGEEALSLPRGAAMDERTRLHVVDAVGQNVKVYDVSGEEPVFLFAFGDWGRGDGQFNYPNDIVLDASGRLYIADRENNRVQVWSY